MFQNAINLIENDRILKYFMHFYF